MFQGIRSGKGAKLGIKRKFKGNTTNPGSMYKRYWVVGIDRQIRYVYFKRRNLSPQFTRRYKNVTKVNIAWIKKELIGKALDFNKDINFLNKENCYHHVGIYSFRYSTLKKFISLSPSNNEINRDLEQMRAIDAKISIGVGYVKNAPISVDTNEDLLKVEKLI